jgi:hypothetical protein
VGYKLNLGRNPDLAPTCTESPHSFLRVLLIGHDEYSAADMVAPQFNGVALEGRRLSLRPEPDGMGSGTFNTVGTKVGVNKPDAPRKPRDRFISDLRRAFQWQLSFVRPT